MAANMQKIKLLIISPANVIEQYRDHITSILG